MFGFEERIASASSVNLGAKTTSQNCLTSASANSASTGRLTVTTPPKADSGSQAKARSYASIGEPAAAQPHGLLCLMIAQVGTSNSCTSSRAELRSSTLLNDSSRPPS